MKLTAKQARMIDYLTKLNDKPRLEVYKARIAKREADKAARRSVRSQAAAEAAALVKVGDVFEASWGYDQTNVDFFQVVAKTGKSVRIKQVEPTLICEKSIGPMAAHRTYDIPSDGTMLPVSCCSVFIKDQENGDLKRIVSWNGNTYIKLSSFCTARLAKTGAVEHYESWYA